MSNESNTNLNVVLGQLEDELRQMKTAKDQVDGMISSNSELAANLERLISSTRELMEESGSRTREASEILSKEAGRLSEKSDTIEKAATEGTEAIRKQASEAQIALEQTADSVVEKTSSAVSELAERAIASINTELDKTKVEADEAIASLDKAASDAKEGRDALLEAHESFAGECKRQNTEMKSLLDQAQKHIADIDTRIATLKEIDVEVLAKELRDLKDVEASNAADLKRQLKSIGIMVGACIVVCLIALAKLFIA